MLLELHIRDFALIDRVDIAFASGLNVLTGETGAGKSIVVDALQLAIGGRAAAEVVRDGQEQASVVAVFHVEPGAAVLGLLAEMDLLDDAEPERILLRRDVLATGRSRARINGQPVTVTQLQRVGEQLVDVHGQHDHQSLLRASMQLQLLDAFGGPEVVALRERFTEGWTALLHARKELAHLRRDERERARRLDLIRFQIEEIDGARLEPGEEERLKQEQSRLAHLGRLQQETARVHGTLAGMDPMTPGTVAALQDGAHTLTSLAAIDPDLREPAQLLEGAALQAEEVARTLWSYSEGLAADPDALEEVASRLALISGLKRKYGNDVPEILRFADQLRDELHALEGSDQREAELSRHISQLEKAAAERAGQLSAARHTAAERLERAVSAELEGLHMGPGRFRVVLQRQEAPDGLVIDGQSWHASATGIDGVQFMLSANPGEPLRPLARIASGGELSRVALALKRSLIAVDPVPTLVFDEIDAGIGGQTAQAVARRLDDIGRRRQVICVTHLAQIATVADRHFHIQKAAAGERTVVHVSPLHEDARVAEIARMLAGVLTEGTLDNARELLALAQQAKGADA